MQTTLCVVSDAASQWRATAPSSSMQSAYSDPLLDISTSKGSFLKRQRVDSSSDSSNNNSNNSTRLGKKRKPSTQRPRESALTDATWSRVQQAIVDAKSLRNITRVTLAFFQQQQTAQLGRAGITVSTYPIPVPFTEVSSMLMPRKRRVYDVLHVLEGVGVIKRAHDTPDSQVSRFRRGHFLYYGAAGAIERLQAIRTRSRQLVSEARRVSPRMTRQKLDTVLLNACNNQAQIEGWSILATTTVAFLSLLLESNDGVVNSLGSFGRRLVEARLVCDGDVQGEVEINRRIYDIVSVLASINAVELSSLSDSQKKESTRRHGFATPRKGVAFNCAIFSNPEQLFIGESCSRQIEGLVERGEASPTYPGETTAAMHAQFQSNGGFIHTYTTVTLPNFDVEEENHSLEDLFPAIHPTEDTENLVDWWNVALRGLLLRDALPLSDCLDWEIIHAISRARARARLSAVETASQEEPQAEHDADLTCHEQLKPE